MILTNENYHSKEANQKYMSVSQFKDFAGTAGKKGCESFALAKLNGEWEIKPSTAMLVGGYVDSHYEGTLDLFRANHPDIFTKQGTLKSEFRKAEEIIQRLDRSELFMDALSGEKQTIMTAELFGVNWKIKMDSYKPGKFITDLKVMKNIKESFWVKDEGKMNFIEYWGYNYQMSIYQKVVELNTNEKLPCYIACVDKTEFPDHVVVGFDQQKLDDTLSLIEFQIKRIIEVKNGESESDSCGICDFCKHNKVLKAPVHYSELLTEI